MAAWPDALRRERRRARWHRARSLALLTLVMGAVGAGVYVVILAMLVWIP